jgi:16S rRNA (adenine1518-N6/adenine1519-N6)-dimethyltransferase
VRADRRFGQHFLEPAWAAKLVDAVAPRPSDTFLEIGAGRGALTLPLATSGARIVAVEIDRRLAAALAAAAPPNVEVVTGDFLDADVPGLLAPAIRGAGEAAAPVRVVGNLPYNVSSPILFKLLALCDRVPLFSDASLMLQREVADRLLAGPGTKEYGVLTILATLRASVTPLLKLPPGAFRPVPKVSSTVVHLAFHRPPAGVDIPVFETLVRGLFQHRRKTLANGLRRVWPPGARLSVAEALANAGVSGERRPETLDLQEMATLAGVFASARG